MPLDPTISLQVRGIEPPNMLAQYAQIAGIQNAQGANRLNELQYQNALRAQADDVATAEAFRTAGNDLTGARNALMAKGLYKPALALDEAQQKRRQAEASINKDEIAAAKDRLSTFSALLAPLVNNPAVSHDDVLTTGKRAEAMGLLQKGWEAGIPMNALEVPAFVRSIALATEQGRKSLEMLLPKVEKVDTGANIGFVNTNPLAGTVGSRIAGAPVIGKEQSPESKASTGLGYANLAETKLEHGRVQKRADQAREDGKWTNDLERGLQVNSVTGATRPILKDGAPLGQRDKSLNESQGRALGFGTRAEESHKILTELEGKGVRDTGVARSVVAGAAGALPWIGDKLEAGVSAGMNVLPGVLGGPSGDQQRVEQARRDFVNAVLRMESGAVISPSEFENASKQYFPQPGDRPEVREQKRRNRQTAIESLKTQSGPGADRPRSAAPGATGDWAIVRIN